MLISKITEVDIAIIGGGVSGTYSAYRLQKSFLKKNNPYFDQLLEMSGKSQLNIHLFEGSYRIGGRLWSYHFSDVPSHIAELGGMCFSKLHRNVVGLCSKELNLPISSCSAYSKLNIQYLRRHQFQFEHYYSSRRPSGYHEHYYPDVIPYFLQEEEKNLHPFALAVYGLEKIVPGLKERIEALQKLRRFENYSQLNSGITQFTLFLQNVKSKTGNKPLYELGFWNELASVLSYEAYNLLIDGIGSDSIFTNINLYDAILNFLEEYLLGIEYFKVDDGYDEVPKTLARKFQQMGGTVNMGQKLKTLEVSENEQEAAFRLHFVSKNNGQKSIISAHYVILALPQHALKLLNQDGSLFKNPQVVSYINSVTPTQASKVFLSHPPIDQKPWWEKLDIFIGTSITDLPISSCLYLGAEDCGNSLMIASQHDANLSHFWDNFVNTSNLEKLMTDQDITEEEAENPPEAPLDMVVEIQRELQEMHNCEIPDPVHTVYQNWGKDPYGGAWHNWNAHVKSWEVSALMRQPIPGYHLYVCGEAFSERQGWVEGALNSAELVLEKYFHLSPPSWVDKDYNFDIVEN